MLKTKNIVISGTNFWNPGDDFVRDGIINVLHSIFPDEILNFLFYNFNQDYFPQSKFSGIHNMASKGDLNHYRDSIDAIVIAGLSAGNEIKDLYNWIIENKLTDRVYLIGAGYENDYVAEHILKEPEKTIFSNARVITGRTKRTPKLIQDLNLPYFHINCPAILSVSKVKEIPEGKKIEKIAFSIQIPHEIGISNQSTNLEMYKLTVQILTELMNEYEITIISHHKSEYFHFLSLVRQFNLPVGNIFSSFYQDLHHIYPQFDLVITTRLHSGLFANGFGIPSIIINDTDRHTHTLQGFPHSTWINSKEKFYEIFELFKTKSLKKITEEADEFKKNLMVQYKNTLSEYFGSGSIKKPLGFTLSINEKKSELPIHFFTIVLNGKPFIEYHIEALKDLPFNWKWHIIEGVADLKNDTSWSLQNGGFIDDTLHNNGLSKDGTTEYLDELCKKYPDNVIVYRKERGQFWNGKLEMVNAPIDSIKEESILWEIDSDELWTKDQIIKLRELFLKYPNFSSALFYCHFFVGENLVVTSRNTYGNHTDYEWLRCWRYMPGDKWTAHEPPTLSRLINQQWINLGFLNPSKHDITEKKGLIFQHFAYATEDQLRFKEKYYGYKDAVRQWHRLQNNNIFPVMLKDYFHWVNDETTVDTSAKQKINPIARKAENGKWIFEKDYPNIGILRLDSIGDNVLFAPVLEYFRNKYPGSQITYICQDRCAEIFYGCPYIDNIIVASKVSLINENKYREDFIQKLNSLNLDLIINPIYSREPIQDIIISKINCNNKIGFDCNLANMDMQTKIQSDKYFSELIKKDPNSQNETQINSDFLDYFKIQHKSLQPVIWIDDYSINYAKELFRKNKLIPEKTIAVFFGTQFSVKDYNDYGQILSDLSNRYDYKFVFLGDQKDYEFNERNIRNYKFDYLNLCGQTSLLKAAAIIKMCTLSIGGDTSLAHIACAVNTPNVIILGGGHYGRFIPYSPLTSIVCLPLECYQCDWRCVYNNSFCIGEINPKVLEYAIMQTLFNQVNKTRIFVQSSELYDRKSGMPEWKKTELIQLNHEEIVVTERMLENSEWVNKDDSAGLIKKAERLIKSNNTREAKSILDEIISNDSHNIMALNDLAIINIINKNYSIALELLNKVLVLSPGNKTALRNKSIIDQTN